MSTLSMIALRQRHELGVKLTKHQKELIKLQLKRFCTNPDCKKSLAFTRKGTFCGPKCASHASSLKRKANRKKKRDYYTRHGITFNKTIRKRDYTPPEISDPTRVKEYSGEKLLYENYKEPLKQIEKGKGYGYYGTLALTEDNMYVQCHICGHLFASLGNHLSSHKVSGKRYREIYGLATKTSLASEVERIRKQKLAVRVFEGKLPDHLIEYNRKVQEGLIKHNGNKGKDGLGRGSWSLEKRNKEGLCPDQVLEKIRELADKLGHTPSEDEFRAEHNGRYIGPIRLQHGSYLEAVKKLGMKSAKELKEHTTESLLQALRDFVEKYGRTPMTSDFERGFLPSRNTYFHRFGTLNNARIEAGLNAVVSMPFGQIMELTPEQYAQYQGGHRFSKDAERKHKARLRRKA